MNSLNKEIIDCRKCRRLVQFRELIAKKKRKQYLSETYWGKAVPGFGSLKAEILILGLAPAAHGANRTGRVFTGDRSASFLFKCLHKVNISNQPDSIHKADGLNIFNTFITCAIKCVPPQDKPTSKELSNCSIYFSKELKLLKNLRVILTLGKVAFDTCIRYFNLEKKKYKFIHGEQYQIKKNLVILACYHPSPRNVNTKRINENKMIEVFTKIKRILKPHHNI